MKKENKKLAQQIRAKEREAAARKAKLKKIIPATVIGAAAVVLVVGIIVTVGNGGIASADTEAIQTVSSTSIVSTSQEAVSTSSEPKSDIETPSERGVLQANKDLVVKEGDLVDIDYVGKIDGVAFDGGDTKGAGARLRIGSGQYIAGFEDQIIGHKPGETFDVVVTFPEDYGAAELAGKEAVFTTTLNGIYKE
ncbi:MAG: FKBP-type peptidyl-prolyl cis-trans isomerase [Eubacterium sp.]|nr:FKBP-type peptidyl-prolyl cis-trans isomerase [Eubacterium sp.]